MHVGPGEILRNRSDIRPHCLRNKAAVSPCYELRSKTFSAFVWYSFFLSASLIGSSSVTRTLFLKARLR